MAVDIKESKQKRNEFGLWLAWTLATTLSLLIGYLLLAFLTSSMDLGLARVLVPVISGLLLGLAQWLVLRLYVGRAYDWILNQASGWVVGYGLGLLVVQLFSRTPLGMLLGFVFFGAIVGIFQYPILQREVPHLALWILANVAGWTLGAYLSQLAAGIFFQHALPTTVTGVLVSVGVSGLVTGAITGVAFIIIVRQPDRLAA